MKLLPGILVAMALGFASFSTVAQESDTSCTIDPDWKQEKITRTLNECKELANESPEIVAERLDTYAEVAKSIAEAIGIAAREVGIATNEFVKTDAGKITLALIVWHVAGDDIKGIIFGIPLAIFAVFFFLHMLKRCRSTGEFIEVPAWFGKTTRLKEKLMQFDDLDGPAGFTIFMSAIFAGALFIVAICVNLA